MRSIQPLDRACDKLVWVTAKSLVRNIGTTTTTSQMSCSHVLMTPTFSNEYLQFLSSPSILLSLYLFHFTVIPMYLCGLIGACFTNVWSSIYSSCSFISLVHTYQSNGDLFQIFNYVLPMGLKFLFSWTQLFKPTKSLRQESGLDHLETRTMAPLWWLKIY